MRPCLELNRIPKASLAREHWIAYQTKGVVLTVAVIIILLQLVVIANDDESIAPILH